MNQNTAVTQIPASCKVNYIRAKTTHSLTCVPILNPSLIWIKQGTKRLLWQHHEEVIDTGSVILLPAFSEFYITNQASDKGYLAEVVSVSDELINSFVQQHNLSQLLNTQQLHSKQPKKFGIKPSDFIQKALSDVIHSLNTNAPSSILHSYINVLLMALHESNSLHLLVQPSDNNLLSERVKTAVLHKPEYAWTVANLANRFNMSPTTFRRHLSKEQHSFRQIVDDVRLGIALSAVQDNKLSIQEIAFKVGYYCPSNFSAKFKKRYGMSPSELRKVI